MRNRWIHLSPCLTVVLLVAACATTDNNQPTTWRNPSYSGPPFKKIMVIGLSSKNLNDQRGFENIVVYSLQGTGVAAVPGWQFIPTDRTPDQATIRAAVAQAGADAVLLVRLSGFTTQSAYGTVGVVTQDSANMYSGWYAPAIVDVQVATIYTTLFDVRTAQQVWTFTAPTYDSRSLQTDAPRYARDVTAMLQSSGLLGGP
jgi:hypothetical protein